MYSLSLSTTVFVKSQTYQFLFISFSLYYGPIKNLTLLTFSVIVGTSNYKCYLDFYVHYCYIFILKPSEGLKIKCKKLKRFFFNWWLKITQTIWRLRKIHTFFFNFSNYFFQRFWEVDLIYQSEPLLLIINPMIFPIKLLHYGVCTLVVRHNTPHTHQHTVFSFFGFETDRSDIIRCGGIITRVRKPTVYSAAHRKP